MSRDAVHDLLRDLVALAAPSGVESPVVDLVERRLDGRGTARRDPAGNWILRLEGRDEAPPVALVAHADEIAAVVKRVEDDGRVRLQSSGDSHPWIWGEAPLLLLGDVETVPALLSFGARHVSEESPQRKQVDGEEPVRWRDVWGETKRSAEDLAELGVRAGTRAVLAPSRREPLRLGAEGEWFASPNLDDRAAVAALVLLAERLETPRRTVDLVLSAREEVGCHGVRYYVRRQPDIDEVVAVEIAPVAEEYALPPGPDPVLLAGDAASAFDDDVTRSLAAAARRAGHAPRHVYLSRYGCDASLVYREGLVARAGAIAIGAENTHGSEIVHLDGISAVADTLAAWLE